MLTGRISSFQSLGAVDGPGLRCVVFMQGCPLRCAYCHNPETWLQDGGQEIELSALVQKIERYRPYVIKTGGVTVSGGEPLLQAKFVAELFCTLQALGYHTTLDTSGIGDMCAAKEVLKYTNLVLADLKFVKKEDFAHYCHGDLSQVHDFLKLTSLCGTPVRLRQVIVPGINDKVEDVKALKAAAMCYPSIQEIELLPFRTLCEPKYEDLKIPFPLHATPECTKETIDMLQEYLR